MNVMNKDVQHIIDLLRESAQQESTVLLIHAISEAEIVNDKLMRDGEHEAVAQLNRLMVGLGDILDGLR